MVLEEFLSEWRNSSDRVLVHTSGSTGAPKPMWPEKEKMRNSARITCDFLGLQPGDTALLCMNLKYIGAKMVVVRSIERRLRLLSVEPSGHPMAALLQGQSVTETDFHDPAALPHPCPQGQKIPAPTFAAMVPLQVYNTLQVPEEAALLRQIRHLIIGGGAIDDQLAAALRDFPHAVWSTYGMTETLSHIALRRLNGPEASDWYTPFDGVTLSLTDEGCLVISAPAVHEGPLVTNDIAELSPPAPADSPPAPASSTRRFRILGRKDNVVCSGGIKIQIEEVERLLRPHLHVPYMITKAPDEKLGEQVVLLTESKTVGDVLALCRLHLPKYWVPRRILSVDRLPLTETGKPARHEAERMAMTPDRSQAPL